MPSKHSASSQLLDLCIFDSMESFSDFESRVSSLAIQNSKMQGDAFEIFVEAYIATQPFMLCKEVWLVGSIPPQVRELLNLPNDSKGIDGVYLNELGVYVPYQVKFRSKRVHLGFAEVSTFLGITDEASDRLLITNCDSLSNDVKNRKNFRSIRGFDFDNLTSVDLNLIEAWLKNKKENILKFKPRDYQKEAIDSVITCYESNDRTNIVMACGTGKTLISLWTAEKLRPKSVIVFLPTLILMEQTIREWCQNQNFGEKISYLCVCSDQTIAESSDEDELLVSSSELPFAITTDKERVVSFLNSSTPHTKIIFTTYQSCHIVAQSVQNFCFDFGVFDEAHRTSGLAGKKFSLGLSNENINIKRRLFMTATPKIYDLKSRNDEGDLLYESMDDVNRYGPRSFSLSFGNAVKRKIIAPYKVIVSIIDKSQVDDFSLQNGVTLVDSSELSTLLVAIQLSVLESIKKINASKVITFHSRVRSAKNFASEESFGISKHLPEFKVFHINGKLSSSDRKYIIRDFANANKSLITNAQCLTEGIDVPSVDMVVFVDPKQSRIAITQAIGRAMRLPPNKEKECGYVLVPIFLDESKIHDSEKSGSLDEFEDVAVVFKALMEQDEEFFEIIQNASVLKGRSVKMNMSHFGKRVEFISPRISFEKLSESVAVKVINYLGSSWDEWYGRLLSYVNRFKTCIVPSSYVTATGYKLGTWVHGQRQLKDKLTDYRRFRLESIDGWTWDVHKTKWDLAFGKLEGYASENGSCKMPNGYMTKDFFKLYAWANLQRSKKEYLSSEQIKKLESLNGWTWDTRDTKWDVGYEHLCSFVNEHKHAKVPVSYVVAMNNYKLGSWVARQRRTKESLDLLKIKKLESLPFWSWSR